MGIADNCLGEKFCIPYQGTVPPLTTEEPDHYSRHSRTDGYLMKKAIFINNTYFLNYDICE